MAKVIQVRGVSDDVHAKLVAAAERSGKSLTKFVSDELEVVARRTDAAEHNRRVIERLRSEVGKIDPPDGEVVRIFEKSRQARTRQLVERHTVRSE